MRLPLSVQATLLAVVCVAGPAPGAHAQEHGALRSVGAASAPARAVAARPSATRSAVAARALAGRDSLRQRADRWLAMDKAKHAGSSFLLVLGGQYVFEQKATLEQGPALALSLSTGAAVGLTKEVYDRYAGPARYFSARDLVADALGLLLGAGVVLL
ncbi:MAG: hypothetical protein BRD48_04165 [Bacteroidetes bacterium QS_9_68_14]|nr:MAG: hypothetical protein BRD48_04165 [Bacteroidetes bacterium QS_9_68_14]